MKIFSLLNGDMQVVADVAKEALDSFTIAMHTSRLIHHAQMIPKHFHLQGFNFGDLRGLTCST